MIELQNNFKSNFNVVLVSPEIPHNTGNIIRLCANTGVILHLIRPIQFDLDDRKLRSAALDYRDLQKVKIHDSFTSFLTEEMPSRLIATSPEAKQVYTDIKYTLNDYLLFGSESSGLPLNILKMISSQNIVKLPMMPNNRSLNISNVVAIVIYEAWKQIEFRGSY